MSYWSINIYLIQIRFIFLISVGLQTLCFAQPGTLDNDFGMEGKLIVNPENFRSECKSIAIQADKKIVFGGYSQDSLSGYSFVLMRCDTNGILDTSFGIGGIVITSADKARQGNAIVVQNDGKILLGGSSGQGTGFSGSFALDRYNSDGSSDSTFGINGKVITNFLDDNNGIGYYNLEGKSVSIQSDGKILLAGFGNHWSNDRPHFLVVRYNRDGSLDNTFGTDGKVIGRLGMCNFMVIQNEDDILLGGSSNGSFAMERYNSDGSLDSTFGTDGEVIGGDGSCSSIVIQNDEKILLSGTSDGSFAMERYNSDGSLDITFGTEGKVRTSFGSSSVGSSVAIQSDGKILLTGTGQLSNNDIYRILLVRYHGDGSLDDTFGSEGRVTTSFGSFNRGNSLAIQSDGKILIGGSSTLIDDNRSSVVLVRYNSNVNERIIDSGDNRTNIRIFPNPFISSTTIKFDTHFFNGDLKIYDTHGQVLKHMKNLSGQNIQLRRENLAPGIYFLQLTERNEVIAGGRLIIIDE